MHIEEWNYENLNSREEAELKWRWLVWILCNSFWTWDWFTADKQFWTGRDAFRYKANKGDHIASCQGNIYYTSLKKVRDTIMELCLSVASI